MKELIKNFPEQLQESINISKTYQWTPERTITNIVMCGLGGSGIGAEIVKEWARSSARIPIEVCHSYELPAYVGRTTLVITCSYSGNTEETLSALAEAFVKQALVVGISSGGKLTEILTSKKCMLIKVPGGLPPRSALAYPLIQLIELLEQGGFLKTAVMEQVGASIAQLKSHQQEIIALAEKLLARSEDKKILLYSEDKFRPVLLRTCQQINENSKELAFFNVIPEMNHNEIVGWAKDPIDFLVIFVRSDLENERNARRLDITSEIVSEKSATISVQSKGVNLIEQSLYLIHLFDWLSYLKAEQKGIDVVEVKVIDHLKAELAK